MTTAKETRSASLRTAGAVFLAAALTSISAYAVEVSDLYVMRRPAEAAAGASDEGDLYRVDEANGADTAIVGSWNGFTSIASDGGLGAYVVQHDSIWYLSFVGGNEGQRTLVSNAAWSGPTLLAYGAYTSGSTVVQSLTAWQGDRLYKVNPSTGAVAQLGTKAWTDQDAMVYLNHNNNGDGNDLFVVQADALWRVNVSTGAFAPVGGGDWSDTSAMTTDGTTLYVACQNHLYKANPSTGSSTDLGGGWYSTTAFTFFNGWLYAIDGSDLYRIDPATGSTTLLGTANSWPGINLMTFRSYNVGP